MIPWLTAPLAAMKRWLRELVWLASAHVIVRCRPAMMLACLLAAQRYGGTGVDFNSACFANAWVMMGLIGGVLDGRRVAWLLTRTRGVVRTGKAHWRLM